MAGRREGVPGTVKGLALVSFFNDFASEMVYPLLPAFVTRTLGGGAAALGMLDGAADLTSAVLKWFTGTLSDRPALRRPLILAGYATAVLTRPLIGIANAAWQVIGFRVVDRVGKGLRTAPRDALIAEITPPAAHGRAFGFHRGADHLGAVIGSVAAWWFLQHGTDVRKVIQWSAVPGIVAFLALWFVLRGTGGVRRRERAAPAGEAERSDAASRRPSVDATGHTFWLPVSILTALTLFRLPEALLLLRLQDVGVPIATIPLVWAGLHVVRTAVSYPGGALNDRVGPRATVAAGGILFALIAVGLARTSSLAMAVGTFLALGPVAGLTEPSERALVARLAPVRTGRGFGAYHALTGLAALPAAAGFGWLYQTRGGPVALHVSAGLMTLGVVLWVASGWWTAKRGSAS